MSAVVAPLFTAERDGRQLRAFAPEGSAPELPWFALADLAAALALNRDDEVEFLAGFAGGVYGLQLRTVVTADGPLVLVDQPDAFLILQIVSFLEDGPPTLSAACALFEDALTGGIVAAVAGLEKVKAAAWEVAAWERGSATMEANAERYRRGGERLEQGHG